MELQGQLQDKMEEGVRAMKGFKIEQGPGLLRLLACGAGAASFVCAIYLMLSLTQALSHPVMYILYVYIAVFAFTTILFEAKQEWIQKLGPLSTYQDKLIQHCEFLTLMGGRGLFYLFQATLWLTFADSLAEIFQIGAAIALGVVGVLHLFAHWGIFPHNIAQKAIAQAESLTGQDINANGVVGN